MAILKNASLTRDEVYWTFRILLDREPDSKFIDQYVSTYSSLDEVRSILIGCEEFRQNTLTRHMHHPVLYRPKRTIGGSKKLALTAIMKNECEKIGIMLQSCLSIVSFVSLVDTGSSDQSIDIARAALEKSGVPYNISQIEFVDFAHARNLALDKVPTFIDWVLTLDADEYIIGDDFPKIIDMINTNGDVDGWQFPRYNFLDAAQLEPPLYYPDYQRRLIRNKSNIRYIGRVHETLCNVMHWAYAPLNDQAVGGTEGGPHIHHTVWVGISDERRNAKHRLYASLE